ncbi:BsuPI-related putative proteinase inhibitor [Virgibacillus byunsanensis]|uniref:Intracellular proteinase inhibitor BsuPI domain-containing protein n=1 Tax=Virgibacillus byunsanensis TaxID=570945 RepID=A0ABW3LNW9_9BACI
MRNKPNRNQEFNPINININPIQNNGENSLSFFLQEVKDSNADKTFRYTVINEGNQVQKLSFNTSQRYEYELFSKEHGLVERYSDGKMFLQVLQDIMLAPKEKLTYDISFSSLEKGEYSLTVFLTARGLSHSKRTITFRV